MICLDVIVSKKVRFCATIRVVKNEPVLFLCSSFHISTIDSCHKKIVENGLCDRDLPNAQVHRGDRGVVFYDPVFPSINPAADRLQETAASTADRTACVSGTREIGG